MKLYYYYYYYTSGKLYNIVLYEIIMNIVTSYSYTAMLVKT